MGIALTPYAFATTVFMLITVPTVVYLLTKGYKKAAAILVASVILILVLLSSLVKLTTDTDRVNANRAQAIQLQKSEELRALPPRVVVEREYYDQFLDRKKAQLKSNQENQ